MVLQGMVQQLLIWVVLQQLYIIPMIVQAIHFINMDNPQFKASSGLAGAKYIGVHKSAEQITGINILPSTGSWDNITVNVYGLASN